MPGGTRTVWLLADEREAVLATSLGPGVILQSSAELEVEKMLHRVMEEALGDRGRPAVVCFGIAGVDRDDDARVVGAIMRRISPGSRVLVVNDALIGYVAGVDDAPGIVVVAGTGSIAYGRNSHGVAARAGCWDHVIGDEGRRILDRTAGPGRYRARGR